MNSTSFRCKQNFGDHNVVRISLSKSEKVSFTISQFNQKFVGRSQNKGPAFMRIILSRERNNNEEDFIDYPYEYIDGRAGHEENITISHYCQPGDYLVFIEIQGNINARNFLVLRTFSKDIPMVDEVKGNLAKDFLPSVLKSLARRVGDKKTYKDKDEPDIFRCLNVDEENTKYGYLYYENNSKHSTLKEEVSFGDLRGINVLGHLGKRSIHIEVGPGSNHIIVLDQVGKEYVMK